MAYPKGVTKKNYGPGGVYKKLDAAYAAYCADRKKQDPNNPNITLAPKQRFAEIWGWRKGGSIVKAAVKK